MSIDRNDSRAPAERDAAAREAGLVTPEVLPPTADQTTVELVRSVLVDARDLMTKELESARLELQDSVKQLKRAARSMAVAGGVLLLATILLAMALGFGLAAAIGASEWAGFLIAGGVLAVIGLIAYAVGRRSSHKVTEGPARTAQEIKQDLQWIGREAARAS